MSSFLNDTKIKRWMKLGAKEAVIEDLTITDTLILPADIVLSDVIIANQTNVGEVNIGCLDSSSFNLQTATNGNDGEVLKTDGNGLCYWGTNSGPGSGIVFNGDTPIASEGYHTTISVDGLGLNLSKLQETTTFLNMGDLEIKNANLINCIDVQTDDYFSLNQELQKIDNFGPSTMGFTDVIGTLEADRVNANYIYNKDNGSNFIEMPNNEDAIKVYTTDFLFNGQQVATIDDIPEPQTFQDVYNSSPNPSVIQLVDNKDINFLGTDGDTAFTISSVGGTTSAGGVNGGFFNCKMNTIQRADFIYPDIEVIEDIPFKTIRTTFTEDQEFITKKYVDDAIPPTFQEVYDASSSPAIITMTETKKINYTRNDNPILTLDSLNYKLTAQDVSVAQITSNNYFPPDSGGLNNWSLSPYNFTASASSVINFAHEPGTSFSYIAVITTDGWISANNQYDLITGAATTATSTLVDGLPVIGEYLQLFTSIAVAINGFYYGGLTDTSESHTAVDFQLVGSNDGVNFTLLSTQTAQTIIFPGKQYIIPTTIVYKYFRFIIQSIIPNTLNGRCAVGSGTAFDIILANPVKIRLLDDAVEIDGTYLTANNFIKTGGTNSQYLMADGSTTTGLGNPTYQDIYNNSPNPALTTLLDGKNIRYIGEDGGDLVMEIDGDFGAVRMPIIETNQIRKQNALLDNILVVGVGLTANNFTKTGGTNSQYLMADGSTTAISAIGSNIYLYKFSDNTTPPPTTGHIRFNNNTLLSSVSNVYISHITNNSIDIDPFFISIQTNNILYIQHTTLSTEWIKFTITATPTITPESFISIPVSLLGNGTFNPPSNIFANNTDIYFSIFSSTATTNPFNQSLNTTDNVNFNSVSLTAPITTNTQATTKLYVDNKVGAITLTNLGTGVPLIDDATNPSFSIRSLKSTTGNDRIDIAIGGIGGSELTLTNPSPATSTTITSTDNNLLTITGTSPNFSITPKYTYMLTFGGNNNNTSSQWLQYGTLRTASPSGTNAATFQGIVPISSTIVWASITRTTTTGTCSLGFSINGGTVVVITPSLLPTQASNPNPYPLNSVIPANGNLGVSVLSSVLSGNCLVSFLLRSN
jgi:hypothetical protein